jgi:hypothetical protein
MRRQTSSDSCANSATNEIEPPEAEPDGDERPDAGALPELSDSRGHVLERLVEVQVRLPADGA